MPLHEAVEFIRDSKYSAFESMFNILQSYGAILNVQTCTGGDTPLFRAILLEKDKAATLLIHQGKHSVSEENCWNVATVRKAGDLYGGDTFVQVSKA